MSVNVTVEEVVMVEECEEKETFHIYLLTFVYSLLAVSGRGREGRLVLDINMLSVLVV